jgi:hypothetical protein
MHYYHKPFRSLWQAMGIIVATLVVVSGVTFAALQSQQAILKGNSIQTAVANLKLSADNINYSNSLDGYTFGGLIPGGNPTPLNGDPIYTRNDGTTALALKLSVNSTLTNPNTVDLEKVHVILTPFGGGVAQNMTLADLIAANTTGGIPLTIAGANHLTPSANTGFMMQISLENDAVSGASATIGSLEFDFDATAVN